MRVVVIGGGVVGTTTAHFLKKAGADVVLIESNSEPGIETSYANAGSLTASRAGPWASPATIMKTLTGYFSKDSAFRLALNLDPNQYRWLAGFVATAFSEHRPEKRIAMIKLGLTSIQEWEALNTSLGLQCGTISKGLLTVYKNASDLSAAAADAPLLDSLGIKISVLDKDGCAETEPNANWNQTGIAGGILNHTDQTADCLKFTQSLTAANVLASVENRLGETVLSVDARRFGACRVITDKGELTADAVVVAAGIGAINLAAAHGVRLPIYPVKGYSITTSIPEGKGPSITISDERRKVFISPMDGQIRAAGIADIVGYKLDLPASRFAVIERSLTNFFPTARLSSNPAVWTSLRAMTHDGPPVLCGINGTGLWFNTGHGSLGWTFACGAGKQISDMVLARRWAPENPYFGLDKRWLR